MHNANCANYTETALKEEIRGDKKTGFITGFTTSNGLMLDLDRTTFQESKQIAEYWNIKFQLQQYLIIESSPFNYHVIFGFKTDDWGFICSMLGKIAWHYHFYNHNSKPQLTNWILLQIIKGSQTLRISMKNKKPVPKIVKKPRHPKGLMKDYIDFCKNCGGTPK